MSSPTALGIHVVSSLKWTRASVRCMTWQYPVPFEARNLPVKTLDCVTSPLLLRLVCRLEWPEPAPVVGES